MKTRLLKRLRRQSRRIRIKEANGFEVDIYINGRWVDKLNREKDSRGLYRNPKITFSLLRKCKIYYIVREVEDMRQKVYDRDLRVMIRFLERC